jgi:rRNA biogenesis protein RRP5
MESQDFETNLEEEEEEEEDRLSKLQVPELSDMFKVGQYVRAVVSAVHPPGASDTSGIGRSRDEASRSSRRVELCLIPERVNLGVQKSDLKSGFARIIFL